MEAVPRSFEQYCSPMFTVKGQADLGKISAVRKGQDRFPTS